jgi:uncharacterized protein (DUF433 family)
MSDWRSLITVEPDKLGGKPCIRGMRMSVADVLEYLASGMTNASPTYFQTQCMSATSA